MADMVLKNGSETAKIENRKFARLCESLLKINNGCDIIFCGIL